jgi:hypothetical protein
VQNLGISGIKRIIFVLKTHPKSINSKRQGLLWEGHEDLLGFGIIFLKKNS